MIGRVLDASETDALWHVIRSPRDRAIFKLCYFFGLSLSEITRLRLADWNDSDYLRVPQITVNRGRFGFWEHDLDRPPVANAVRLWIKIRAGGRLDPSSQAVFPHPNPKKLPGSRLWSSAVRMVKRPDSLRTKRICKAFYEPAEQSACGIGDDLACEVCEAGPLVGDSVSADQLAKHHGICATHPPSPSKSKSSTFRWCFLPAGKLYRS